MFFLPLQYSSIDSSPIGKYITHPFWNFVVKVCTIKILLPVSSCNAINLLFSSSTFCYQFCPTWIAPNVLTFSGFLLTVVNFVMFAYYDPCFDASSANQPDDPPIPRWVFLAAAINLFLAHTLGKH